MTDGAYHYSVTPRGDSSAPLGLAIRLNLLDTAVKTTKHLTPLEITRFSNRVGSLKPQLVDKTNASL